MGTTRKALQALAVIGLSLATGATSSAPSAATTADERAIYNSVLSGWLDGNPDRQRVDRRLGDPPAPADNAECTKGVLFSGGSTGSLETLDASVFHGANVELVDGSTWRADDPEDGMRQGKSVDDSVKAAFAHSLFSFSRIAFSADGNDALVSYGMRCGRLCGHGSTVHMHKANGRWRSVGDCGGWIS